jgi:hypothetical protein
MGLDMYAYCATRAGAQNDWYEDAQFDPQAKEYVNPNKEKPREIAYWRKHPNLHGWMEQLWVEKMQAEGRDDPHTFNGIELELTWEDLDKLEYAVKNNGLPGTRGFFFGDDADEYYKDQDLEFIKNARAEIFCGLKVFYNSSW